MPQQRKSSIRDTDDYLTARFANPLTGLISPSVYSLGGTGTNTPQTPRTPGEALSIFYGRTDACPPKFKASPTYARTLNGYFEHEPCAKRPPLRRHGDGYTLSPRESPETKADIVFEVLERNGKSRGMRAIASVSEKQSSSATDAEFPTVVLSAEPSHRLDRVASYWSKARRQLYESGHRSPASTEHTARIVTNLSHLPPVRLIHPSQAAKPRLNCGNYLSAEPMLVASSVSQKTSETFGKSSLTPLRKGSLRGFACLSTLNMERTRSDPRIEADRSREGAGPTVLIRIVKDFQNLLWFTCLCTYGVIICGHMLWLICGFVSGSLHLSLLLSRLIFWLCGS